MIKHSMKRILVEAGIIFSLCLNNTIITSASTSGATIPIAGTTAEMAKLIKKSKNIKISYKKGWVTTNVNVRSEPNIHSEIYEVYNYNKKVYYTSYNKKWVMIKYNNKIAFMAKDYISKKKLPEITYKDYYFSGASTMKSWMPYTAITATSSSQYKIQHGYAYTGNYGIRMVGDRYCVAVGSYFNVSIGQKLDLILENGTVIKCIAADAKANKDTNGIFTNHNGCCSEFIVDSNALNSSIRRSGNISSACDAWNSKVIAIRVYNKNIF